MSIEDQDRYKFQMPRVLSITRSMHSAAPSKKSQRRRRPSEAKSALERAASTLASVRQQYFEQQEELQEDKIALHILSTKLSALDSGSKDKDPSTTYR